MRALSVKNKKGDLTITEILELVLAAAGIFLLIFLLYKLIAPNFDKENETAKSYLQTFQTELKKADAGQIGEFSIWQDKKIFLVYLGKYKNFAYNEPGRIGKENTHLFSTLNAYDNYLCFCYDDGEKYVPYNNSEYRKTICKNCISLNVPARISGAIQANNLGQWAANYMQKVIIQKQGDQYNLRT